MRLPFFGRIKRPLPWLIGLGLIGLAAAGAIAFTLSRRGPNYDLEALTVPVASTELTVRITASGRVEPERTVNLSPKSAGTVRELYVEQGDLVTRGQLIAQMNREQVDAQLTQSRAGVAEAQAQLDEARRGASTTDIAQAEASVSATRAQLDDARARLSLSQADNARSQSLFDRGAISRSELDSALSDRRSAQAGVDQAIARLAEAEQRLIDQQNGSDVETIAQAEARLRNAQGQLAAVQSQLDDTQIRAPFDGIVTQRFASEGAFVTPTATASEVTSATSTAIVAIASGLEVVAEVPEADISRIKVGQAVEIQADAFPEETFKGEVQLIAPEAIERQNVTVFQVRIELLTGTDQLRSNMNTTVAFIGEQLADALVVPAVAIITQGGETGVLVPGESGQAQLEPVVLGSQVGDRIQVLDGLAAGDRVFIDQQFQIPRYGQAHQRFVADEPSARTAIKKCFSS
ncbi:efflux RND transporter periplasmic adaptor subunit, partial [Leptolyngbya sp. BC1307]|uniref:efflux RND transporter periplasmic adaptor subunit n=1 Tax=Leptolyngbya sp. BC1307 TaxID=2029589 RepID=UPI001483799C